MDRSSLPFPRRFFAQLLALALLSIGLTGCGRYDTLQSALDPKGPVAQQQYDTFMLTLWVTGILWFLVGGALLYAVWRFRRRKGNDSDALPKQSHGNPLIELSLIALSAVALVIIAIPTLQGIVFMKRLPQVYEEGALRVNVTGYQWWWEFEYPELGIITANELVFPVGRAVKLHLRSGDVNHSFWLPKLAGKTDLIPGQENFMWIKADEPGMYWGQCAEFCGDSHAYMLFRARVTDSEESFQQWVAKYQGNPVLTPKTVPSTSDPVFASLDPEALQRLEHGQQVFNQHCLSCHRIGNEGGRTGPNLSHFASRATLAAGWLDNTPDNLRRWIKEPHLVKPGNYMWRGVPLGRGMGVMEGLKDRNLTDEQVEAVASYLEILH